jgi:hypothetical protein
LEEVLRFFLDVFFFFFFFLDFLTETEELEELEEDEELDSEEELELELDFLDCFRDGTCTEIAEEEELEEESLEEPPGSAGEEEAMLKNGFLGTSTGFLAGVVSAGEF